MPYGLPPRLRGLGQSQLDLPYAEGFESRATRRIAPKYFSRTASSTQPKAKASKTRKKRKTLKHGDPIYCVYAGREKVACSRLKENAEKIAKREKLKRAKGVRIRKMKYELRCPPGTRRKCKERKSGSRQCKRMGCTKE